MFKRIIGFSVMMMVLSIFAAHNDVKAVIEGDGWCEIYGGSFMAATENMDGSSYDYMSVSGYCTWIWLESPVHTSATTFSAENTKCKAVYCYGSSGEAYGATGGSINATHYISDFGETWSGTWSNSF